MKKIIYILLAGLAAAGLASCDKQDFNLAAVGEIYAVEMEEDILQTKSSAIEIENGSERTFYATLKNSSDGGKTYSYVSCYDWSWGNLSNCTKGTPGTEMGHKQEGIVSGKCTYKGSVISTSSLQVSTGNTSAGNITRQVDVTVTPRKYTVTFNFTPNTTKMLSIMQNKFGTTYGKTGKASVSCPVEVTDGSGNALGSAGLSAFYQYTAPSKLESIKSMSSATMDERVLSLQVKIEEGKTLKFKLKAGNIAFPDNDNHTNQNVSVSQGSKISTPTGYYGEYRIDAVNSNLTVNVTTPN